MKRGSLSFAEALRVSRPLWWVTTCVPFIVGALLATHELNLTIIIGAIYFLIPYNLLIYGINDIFDYESDIRNSRKAGVHGAVLSKLKHRALWRLIIISNLPFILYLAVVGNLESSAFLFMMLYMAFAYSVAGLRYKEIPFIDSLTSAFHYTSPFLFGLFLFESPDLWAPAFAGFYFWAVGTHAFGAIQDIRPDREAGVRSIATYLGAPKTIVFTLTVYIIGAIAPLLAYGVKGLAAAAAIAPYFILVLSTYKHRYDNGSPVFRNVWKRFVVLNYIVGGAASIFLIYLYNR